jgi:hypothetical protein
MATATPARPTIKDLQREADLAAQAREEAHAEVAAAAVSVIRYRTILDPNLARANGGPTPSHLELLTARAEAPAAEQRLADRQLHAERADRRADETNTALREAQGAEFHRRKRDAVTRLAPRLLAAREALDALARLEDEEHTVLGPQFSRERLSSTWVGLMTESPSQSSLLDHWLATARTYGLLDDRP